MKPGYDFVDSPTYSERFFSGYSGVLPSHQKLILNDIESLGLASRLRLSKLLLLEWFQMTVEKPKPKLLLRPITTGTNSAMNQSQFLPVICNSLEAREKLRVHWAFGFGFASHWFKNWRESFKPITKRSNRNHVITFDSHLKTALQWKFDPNQLV